ACNACSNIVSIVCFKYRLQPKPRSVLINSNRVDKRVFLSEQYATVRCAEWTERPAANHSTCVCILTSSVGGDFEHNIPFSVFMAFNVLNIFVTVLIIKTKRMVCRFV